MYTFVYTIDMALQEKPPLNSPPKTHPTHQNLDYKKSHSLLIFSTTKPISSFKSSLTMAYKIRSSLITQLFIFSILLAIAGQAIAGRNIPKNSKNEDMKQPEWFKDHGLFIAGIGRVMVPPVFRFTPPDPYTGSTGGTGSDIPGGDDTFVPNPGFEVPHPGSVGIPAPNHPGFEVPHPGSIGIPAPNHP